jgi:hypothetical protein
MSLEKFNKARKDKDDNSIMGKNPKWRKVCDEYVKKTMANELDMPLTYLVEYLTENFGYTHSRSTVETYVKAERERRKSKRVQ